MSEADATENQLFPRRVGEQLRLAREQAGIDLNDVGTRTRIPLRHLEAIERNDFSALPSPTYAIGFTRAYARVVGLEEAPLVRQVREELGREDPDTRDSRPYEPVDPSRVPTRLLAWTTLALLVLLVGGYTLWRSQYLGGTDAPVVPIVQPEAVAPAAPSATRSAAAPAPAAAPIAGDVVLTATEPVWLRIYDGANTRLFEKEMAAGERYTVPADASEPKILTGRPDALRVTVGGREVAPLGEPAQTIKDVGVSAAALAARNAPPPSAASAAQP